MTQTKQSSPPVIPSGSMRSQSEAYWNRGIYFPLAAGVRLKIWNFPCLNRFLTFVQNDTFLINDLFIICENRCNLWIERNA